MKRIHKNQLIEKEEAGNKDYLALRTTKLLDAFGKGNHIPGSGSAAVLSALIAIEMMRSVLILTMSKEEYKDHWEQFEYILDILTKQYKPKLKRLFNDDIREFHKVSFLRRQRDKAIDGSPEKNRLKKEVLEQLRIETDIPLEVCETSFRLLDYALQIFDKGFKSAKGDSGVAISNLMSAISGSIFVAFLNLKTFNKSEWKDKKMAVAVQLTRDYTAIQKRAFAKVIELYNASNDDKQSQLLIDFGSTQIDGTINSIAEYIDEEKDALYVRGQRKAKEQAQHLFVERLLVRGKATVEEISEDCGVSLDYVLETQRQLKQA